MSGNVISLDSRRIGRGCPNCVPAELCYPHRLESLAHRLQGALDGSLLVSVEAIDDALDVIAGITDECLGPRTRLRVVTPNNPNKEHA